MKQWLGIVALVGVAACAAPPPEPVWVARSAGTLQCESTTIDAGRFVAELKAAGVVPVAAHGCADDGRMRAQRCGASDGRLVVFPVREADAEAARRAGFVPLAQMPSARRVPC